jgi:hypothetical protein
MPALVCSAQNCMYNNAMYCSRGDIKVGGAQAMVCQDTCCESFEERKRDNMRSSVGSPSTQASIQCEATKCRYNEKCTCHAQHVDISGAAACMCTETECVTIEGDR